MADDANGHGKESRGVQAYRWMVTLGIGALGILMLRVLNDIDRAASKVDALNDRVIDMRGTTESRINAHADRFRTLDERWKSQNELDRQQDGKIDELRQRVWRWPEQPPTRTP